MTPTISTALLRTQSDARLAALAREGHDRAFEAIVERYRRELHRYCRRLLPDSRAEDVLQQALMNAWSSLRRGAEVRELRPWLYRIVHNAAVNALARRGYDYDELADSLGAEGTPAEDLERRTIMRETLAGVAALPDRQREALLRTAVEGRSQAEVARELGMTDGALRQLVHRARATLRAAATAVTPMPLVTWLAGAGAHGDPAAQRVAELAAGAGAAGLGATALKAGTVVLVAGTLAVGAPEALRTRDSARPAAGAAGATGSKPGTRPRTPSTSGDRSSGGTRRARRDDTGRGGGRRSGRESGDDRGRGGAGSGRDDGRDSGESDRRRSGSGTSGDDSERSGSGDPGERDSEPAEPESSDSSGSGGSRGGDSPEAPSPESPDSGGHGSPESPGDGPRSGADSLAEPDSRAPNDDR